MRNAKLCLLFAAVSLCLAATASAVTYIVPDDRVLVAEAQAAVVGRVVSVEARERSGVIETVSTIVVEESLKGSISRGVVVQVVTPGGAINGRWAAIAGAPNFVPGERALLLLDAEESDWRLHGFGLGKFSLIDRDGKRLASREAGGAEIHGFTARGANHTEQTRDAELFTNYVRTVAAGEPAQQSYFVSSTSTERITTQAAATYLIEFEAGKPARWSNPSFGFTSIRTQSGTTHSGVTAINSGRSAWNGDSNSNVSMTYGGADATGTFGLYPSDDGKNSVIFDTSAGEMPSVGSHGIAASVIYGSGASHVHPYTGETMYNVTETDVFIRAGIGISSQSFFDQLMAHEMGHSLALKDTAGAALMNSSINGSYGASLQSYDQTAVQTVYGPGPACSAPTITSQPASRTITAGNRATLSVTASGSAPLNYQWYEGASGGGTAISGATSASYQTPILNSTKSYWVKVTNSCGTASSVTATITVEASSCVEISVSRHPASQTVQSGSRATLSVAHTGSSPFTYRWYRGDHSTGTPITGATASSYTTDPLTATTKFWVLITNACDQEDSNEALITVTQSCIAPAITGQPQGSLISSGQTATMTVTATGSSLQYQWYAGASGDASQPVGGAIAASFTTPPLSATTSYWVRVTNGCGTTNSQAATVTVMNACTPPAIIVQPAGTTVPIGSSATLSTTATGSAPLSYQWYRGSSGDLSQPVGGAIGSTLNTGSLSQTASFWVRVSNSCGSVNSATATVNAVCLAPVAPEIKAPANVSSGQSFEVEFEAEGQISQFEIQESTNASFSGATTQTITARKITFTRTATTPTRYFYRVRAFASCNGSAGPYSATAEVAVTPPPTGNELETNVSVPVGSTRPVTFTYKLMPPANGDTIFNVRSEQSWLKVLPPTSGSIPPGGVTLTLEADPAMLGEGTNTASLIITTGVPSAPNAGRYNAMAGGSSNIPISVSMVSPVKPKAKQPSGTGALLIPVVGHAQGNNNSQFLSDVRILNNSGQPLTYKLTFTPTGTNGSTSKETTLNVGADQTKALNDVVKTFFGLGALGESAVGVLEIRPTNAPASLPGLATVASSRTYNLTPQGTFGQYIPAIPLEGFITKAASGPSAKISLQQVAQSTNYRTNFGVVEGAGAAVNIVVRILSSNGQLLKEVPMFLNPFEHRQVNRFLFENGVTSLNDGRIEVEVLSGDGRVTADASVVDNFTNDPLLVLPVVAQAVAERRYTLPGVADFNNTNASWRTDMRLFNGGAASVVATVRFQEFRNASSLPAPVSRQITLQPGQVAVYDNVVQSLFGLSNKLGGIYVTTASQSSLVVSARTYDQRPSGTYGQFIPAVTSIEGVGLGERSLELLQVEQSDRLRSNLGIAELTGNAVTVEVTAHAPDMLAFPKKQFTLAANEFIQLNQVLTTQFNLPPTYNARLRVRVVGGNGKVTAYASVVDNQTQDPTYIPAQ